MGGYSHPILELDLTVRGSFWPIALANMEEDLESVAAAQLQLAREGHSHSKLRLWTLG